MLVQLVLLLALLAAKPGIVIGYNVSPVAILAQPQWILFIGQHEGKRQVGALHQGMEVPHKRGLVLKHDVIGWEHATECTHDRSFGFFRRQIILEARERDPNRKDDPYLAERLCAEKESIFLWALAGLQRLIRNGFQFTLSDRAKANMEAAVADGNNIVEFMKSEGYFRFRADSEVIILAAPDILEWLSKAIAVLECDDLICEVDAYFVVYAFAYLFGFAQNRRLSPVVIPEILYLVLVLAVEQLSFAQYIYHVLCCDILLIGVYFPLADICCVSTITTTLRKLLFFNTKLRHQGRGGLWGVTVLSVV